jgi:ATP-binding cassette, subfamily B, multidrug efflux pump
LTIRGPHSFGKRILPSNLYRWSEYIPVFRFFEALLAPTATEAPAPLPNHLFGFYWNFIRQAKGLFIALLIIGCFAALFDLAIPVLMGTAVDALSATRVGGAQDIWRIAAVMGAIVLILRPLAIVGHSLITNQALGGTFSNLVLWQSHLRVVRQSWSFFQSDFAGRIASKVTQTGTALFDSIVVTVDAVWYILIYGTSTLVVLAHTDIWLAVPVFLWFISYLAALRYFLPRVFACARLTAEARSAMTGRIVDIYSNILTVKLFSRAHGEDADTRTAIDTHTQKFQGQLRLITQATICLSIMNALLIVATAGPAIVFSVRGTVPIGTVAMVLPLTWQLVTMSGMVAFQVAGVFENVGIVQQGKETIAQPLQLTDRADARTLLVRRGEIRFEAVRFGYRKETRVINDLTLDIRAGAKVGLVGRSGAGKSTLVSLLLRFFDLDAGRILVDEQDIALLSQDSLRAQVSVVTQDTSLLHRSIRDNILYGRPDASELDMTEAARRAEAHDFILHLEDQVGRKGYDAHVGERGVALSGGQRQRIAIARLLLKNAPILILDEATSALDSEVEAAIQRSLETLMQGKTVIAIAHRLSTIARMDRLVVLDQGRIAEEGNHSDLLRRDGQYAQLWRHQSHGFLESHANDKAIQA